MADNQGILHLIGLLASQLGGAQSAAATAPEPQPAEKPVLVTTVHRGVFFGYATDVNGPTITLRKGRIALYWSRDVKGVVGLAANGPTAGCRIGPAANMIVKDVTCVMEVTPEAAAKWESAPWSE